MHAIGTHSLGGGVYHDRGNLTVNDLIHVWDNKAKSSGGGVYCETRETRANPAGRVGWCAGIVNSCV